MLLLLNAAVPFTGVLQPSDTKLHIDMVEPFENVMTPAEDDVLYGHIQAATELFEQAAPGEWFITYGTLLGAVRHKQRIPWDDDCDIAFPAKKLDELRKISDGHVIVQKQPFLWRIHRPGKQWPFVDICTYEEVRNRRGRELIIEHDKHCAVSLFNRDDFLPTKQVPFGPLLLPAPARSKKFLSRIYPRWSTNPTDKRHNHRTGKHEGLHAIRPVGQISAEFYECNPAPLVGYIIPTVGRKSIGRLLESVFSEDSSAQLFIVNGYSAGEGRNIGMKAALSNPKIEWLCFCDDDDYYAPGYIEQLKSCPTDLLIVRAQSSFDGVVPKPEIEVLKFGNVCVGFFVNARFLRESSIAWDENGPGEDFRFVQALQQKGARPTITKDIFYIRPQRGSLPPPLE